MEEELRGWKPTPNNALYVNIGGGIGHQCAQFKARYPDLPGRIILQDLEHSIEQALKTPGVENMVHDFFEAQPVKGMPAYDPTNPLPPSLVTTLIKQLLTTHPLTTRS